MSLFDDINEMVSNIPHFALSFNQAGYEYCNPALYQDLEEPIDIYFSFEFYNAAIMYPGSPALQNAADLLTTKIESLNTGEAAIVNQELKETYEFEHLNTNLKKKIKDFFLDIEAVANIKFTESKILSEDKLNIVITGIDKSSKLLSDQFIAHTYHPAKQFSGALIYVRDPNDEITPQEVAKDIIHEILHGLCQAHLKLPTIKEEKQHRSLVEDKTTSTLWQGCLSEEKQTKPILRCAKKVGFDLEHTTQFIPLMRCVTGIIDKNCIHQPTMLTPIDVKHLQYTFGKSIKVEDPTNFRVRFVNSYNKKLSV